MLVSAFNVSLQVLIGQPFDIVKVVSAAVSIEQLRVLTKDYIEDANCTERDLQGHARLCGRHSEERGSTCVLQGAYYYPVSVAHIEYL